MNNKSVYSFLLYFTLVLCGEIDAVAQEPAKVEAWDRSVIEYRPAPEDKMEAYKQIDEYIYDRSQKPEGLWDKLKRWLWSQLFYSGITNKVFLYVLIAIAVLILFFVILKLLGVNITGLFIFAKDAKVAHLHFKQGEEDIYDESLESTLKVAIQNNAYREAVRIMYLLTLRHLDSSERIEWKPWKTNKEYYYELSVKQEKEMFKNLVHLYEYTWYGQFKIEENKFQEVRYSFEEFEQLFGSQKISA